MDINLAPIQNNKYRLFYLDNTVIIFKETAFIADKYITYLPTFCHKVGRCA